MHRTRFADSMTGLPDDQAAQAPTLEQTRCHQPSTHRTFAVAVAGLAAFAAVACLSAPMPSTGSRAAGFPTGDPPPIPREFAATDEVVTPREHAIDVIDACFDPFDIAMP